MAVKDKKTGNNLAHIAAATNGTAIIKDLLAVKRELVSEVNKDGDLPSHVAAELGFPFVVEEILVVAPEVVDTRNSRGQTMKDLVPADNERFSGIFDQYKAHTGEELDLLAAEVLAQSTSEPHVAEPAAEPLVAQQEVEKPVTPVKKGRVVSFYGDLSDVAHTPALRTAASALRKVTAETVLRNPYTPSAASSGMLKALVEGIKDNNTDRVMEILRDNEYLKEVKLKICSNNQIGQDQSKKIEGDLISLTLVHLAAYFGSTDVARYLIDTLEMNPNATASFEGYTPLHLAAKANHTECATYFSTKCLLNKQTEHTGYTALHYAVDNNNVQLVGVLAHRTDLSLLTQRDQENPLDAAAYFGRNAIFQILMQQPSARENISKTTLRKAIKGSSQLKDGGHSDIVCEMVASKPDVVNYYYKSMSSMMEALGSRVDFNALSAIFKESGDMILKSDKDGLNVLHYAVKYGNSHFVNFLKLQKPDHFKALMQAGDKEGNLPIHYVTKHHQCYDALRVLDELHTTVHEKGFLGLGRKSVDKVTHLAQKANAVGQTAFDFAKLSNDTHSHNQALLGFAKAIHEDSFVSWEKAHPFVEVGGASDDHIASV